MKKIILILAVCLACIQTQAQKINKSLLYGKWEIYSFTAKGHPMCRDSMSQNIQAIMLAEKGRDPTKRYNTADSLEHVCSLKTAISSFFKTYMIFDRKGHTTALIADAKNELKEPEVENGTYQWSGKNKIIQKTEKGDSAVFIILGLTATKLVIVAETNYNNKDAAVTFTRGK
jgi:hypothetical protein